MYSLLWRWVDFQSVKIKITSLVTWLKKIESKQTELSNHCKDLLYLKQKVEAYHDLIIDDCIPYTVFTSNRAVFHLITFFSLLKLALTFPIKSEHLDSRLSTCHLATASSYITRQVTFYLNYSTYFNFAYIRTHFYR